jgi:hypothetical protein
MYNWWSQNTECNLKYIYQLLWNIENSNQLSQQLKHTRTKLYIYVVLEYRVPWLEIYKYPLPDGGLLRDFNQVVYCRGINSLVSVEIPNIGT